MIRTEYGFLVEISKAVLISGKSEDSEKPAWTEWRPGKPLKRMVTGSVFVMKMPTDISTLWSMLKPGMYDGGKRKEIPK